MKLLFEHSAFAMTYYATMSSFHAAISKKMPWSRTKSVIALHGNRLEQLTAADNPAFDVAAGFIQDCNSPVSSRSDEFLAAFEELKKTASPEVLKHGETCCRKFAKAMKVKFDKDTAMLLCQNISDDEYVPLTNRAVESTFGRYKQKERRFVSLDATHLASMTLCSMNSLSKWLKEMVRLN